MYDPTASLLESLDPMQKFNEDMKRITDPMYDINKALDPIHSLNESLALAIQPAQEAMASFRNPILEFQKQMEYLYDPMKKIQEQMDSLYSLSDVELNSINSAAVTAKKFQDSLNLALGKTNLQSYSDMFSTQMQSYKNMEKVLSRISTSFNNSTLDSVNNVIEKILERGSLVDVAVASSENETLIEFESMKDEILESLDTHNLKVIEQLEKIYAVLSSMKNPMLLALFMTFILPIVINNISNVIYDNIVKPMITNSKATQIQLKKEVTRSAKLVLSYSDVVTNYRIVTADILNVRKSNSKKSKLIGYTFFGEVVEIVNKKRNWCLIKRYDSESETYIQGWVFTRYLGRIR
jgi:hypothetical protein